MSGEAGTLFDKGKPKDIEVLIETFKIGRCRGENCRQTITWVKVRATGAMMCLQGPVFPDPLSTVRNDGPAYCKIPLEWNHWKDCPDRDSFRRKK